MPLEAAKSEKENRPARIQSFHSVTQQTRPYEPSVCWLRSKPGGKLQ